MPLASVSIAKITEEQPPISQWTGAAATLPTAGTETPNINVLDFGSVAAGSNSDAKAITVNFPPDFDDSVFGVRIWGANLPGFTGHNWFYEASATANFPVGTLSTALTNGVQLYGNPTQSDWKAASLYDSTDKRVQEMIFQLQTAAGAKSFNVADYELTPPMLYIEMERRDRAVSANEADFVSFDEVTGHLFTYSSVDLFEIVRVGNNEFWNMIGGVKEDSITIEFSTTKIDWKKGKPAATFQQAVSEAMASMTFKVDALYPKIIAQSIDGTVVSNAFNHTLDVSLETKSRPTVEAGYAMRWITQGGHVIYFIINRGSLAATGGYQPGATDFAGQEFKLTALVSAGCGGKLATYQISDVPIETACLLPLTYAVTP